MTLFKASEMAFKVFSREFGKLQVEGKELPALGLDWDDDVGEQGFSIGEYKAHAADIKRMDMKKIDAVMACPTVHHRRDV